MFSEEESAIRKEMKKKVDTRIQILIENVIKLSQRGFFIIVGDRGRDQVLNKYCIPPRIMINKYYH